MLSLVLLAPCLPAAAATQQQAADAINAAAQSICAIAPGAAGIGSKAVEVRISALRGHLAGLIGKPVPPLSAADLQRGLSPDSLRQDCEPIVSRVLTERLLSGVNLSGLAGRPMPERGSRPLPLREPAPIITGGSAYGSAAPPPPPAPAPAPPPPAPPANPEVAAIAALDKLEAGLPKGAVAFNAPEQAKQGVAQPIEARLSLVQTEAQLQAELPGTGPKQSSPLQVASNMAATLDGGTAFDVTPTGPQERLVSGVNDTVWDWTITPKLSGQQTLRLTIDALLTVSGHSGTVNIATLQKTIRVTVTPLGWLERIKAMVDTVSWLWSVPPIAAGLGFIWKWLQGRRKKTDAVPKA
jgi:hypothetical protein